MAALTSETVKLELRGQVMFARLNRPPVNALDAASIAAIAAATSTIRSNETIGAVVVFGGERAFSAGADLREIRALNAESGAEAVGDHVAEMQAAFAALAALPIPTIAAIRGAAIGGGLELALACDLRVAANNAKIGCPEIGHGLLPSAGGTQRLTRLVGPSVAARMMLTGEVVDGVAAERMGIVQWAIPPSEVETFAITLAGKIAESGEAAAAIKRCVQLAESDAGYEHEIAATRSLYATESVQRRLATF